MSFRTCIYLYSSLLLLACQRPLAPVPGDFACNPDPSLDPTAHPRAAAYQTALDRHQRAGLTGAVLYAHDSLGTWQGAAGFASLELGLPMETCHRFLIASISKIFTATVVHALVDEGVWQLDDPARTWLHPDTVARLENAESVTLRQLLDHTAGIADYYTSTFELDRLNRDNNHWRHTDILGYMLDQPATHPPGETYYYSNGNYVLLGILAERATGESLANLYTRLIFAPLNLQSAYFDGEDAPIPPGTAQGYGQLYRNGLVNSQPSYQDELKTGDGGIAIHAADLGLFLRQLDQLLSPASLAAMRQWAPLPAGWVDTSLGHTRNGAGLEYFDTPYGPAYGHSGAVDGFLSIAMFFPATGHCLVLLVNEASNDPSRLALWEAALALLYP